MSLGLNANPVNCVCPFLLYLVIDTCLVGIDPTFIAGFLLADISPSGCINSSQTPTFSQGTKAALLLGSPGKEKHTGEWTAEVFGLQLWPYSKEWAGYSSLNSYYRADYVFMFLYLISFFFKKVLCCGNFDHLPAKALKTSSDSKENFFL